VARCESSARRLAEVVRELERDVCFTLDEHGRNVQLTEQGFDRIERQLGCGNLLDEDNYLLLSELHCALHARVLLHRDVDYLVRGGRIELVDEFTGRVVDDRHWPDGLQSALEAKEGLEPGGQGRILGSIALQHLLASYPLLCGMTGTARDAAREIREVYGLGVTVVPTHRPILRVDHPDRVFTHRQAKERAVIEEVRSAHGSRRPVLVGTGSVEESDSLAASLRAVGVGCEVLNARDDSREAEIVARAGALGAVTISTNMAGRGTDSRLGGEDESDREAVVELGGLYVIGTNRHESRRIDRQLRGRAGRQGDPGESRFFVSLEDPLLMRYGIASLIPERFRPEPSDLPIGNPIVVREIDRAQRIVEGQNLEIRQTLCRYAEPVEEQRRRFHGRRQSLLRGEERPGVWARSEACSQHYERLVARFGAEAVEKAEVRATLHHMDRVWCRHLERISDLREGNHLIGLGGQDPLTRFRIEIAELFHALDQELEEAVLAVLDELRPEARSGHQDGAEELVAPQLRSPSATWTYLVNEDPFRDQLAMMLTGPGNTTLSIGAALNAPLFFLLWLVTERLARRRRDRGSGPPARS
ncbi:MAG: hypothetical protein MI919_42550, partial [Holophagales bacterium]|nr:hypothetical protein [Holophagales bacterium]